LAAFLSKLAAAKEGNGSVLDNTVVLFCTEMGAGVNHDYNDTPFVIVGSGGGLFKTGRFVNLAKARNHNDLLLTLYQAFGGPATPFGAPAYCSGPISELRA